MANYLQKNASRPSGINASSSSGYAGGTLPEIDGAYKTTLRAYDGGVETYVFRGYVPEDFNIDLEANWSPKGGLNQFLQDKANQVTRGASDLVQNTVLGGRVGLSRKASYHTWDGPSYLQISLPFSLVAWSSAKEDVLSPMVTMMSLVSAREDEDGVFRAPGLSPFGAAVSTKDSKTEDANSELSGLSIGCTIGNFMTLGHDTDPCLITNVQSAIESKFDIIDGLPMSVLMNVNITTFYPITDRSLHRIFNFKPTVKKGDNGG